MPSLLLVGSRSYTGMHGYRMFFMGIQALSSQARCEMIDRQKELEIIRNQQPDKAAIFEKAYSSHSLKAAIKAKCLQCKQLSCAEVRECFFVACPLHNVRPYQHQPEKATVITTKAGYHDNGS